MATDTGMSGFGAPWPQAALVSSPRCAISLVTQRLAKPPSLFFLPALLMSVPGWESALLAQLLSVPRPQGRDIVRSGHGDGSWLELFHLICPLCP